ncbi:MAG TPA: hypothetical protein DCZ49_06590 [Hyphomonadaceae bacterium]|nr:hypothetical protein [Hyphomonadaceae bacterium]
MVQTETRDLKRGAIAEVALDQRTEGLQIDLARPMRASTLLDQAGNGHRGIGQLNQESGIANQQANLLALAALKASPSTEIGLISAASVQQTAISNRVNRYDLDGENRIDQAFNGASGVVQVNQAIGVGNSQANLFALAFAPASAEADVFALSDIGLSQVASDNEAANGEIVINARNTISQSFGNFSGAAQVSQTAGALNLVANAITINIGLAGGAP